MTEKINTVENSIQHQLFHKLGITSFANVVQSKRMPVANALQKPLVEATGTVFKLVSGTTEVIQEKKDSDGTVKEVSRAVYTVQPLNSKLLPANSEFAVKIKDSKSILTEQINLDLLYNTKIFVITFEKLSHWTFQGSEGLNAKNVHIVDMNMQEFRKFMGELSHE